MVVLADNGGPEPAGGFRTYPAEIGILDANMPPTCTVADEIVVIADSGPLIIPDYLLSSSVGINEEWQKLIVRITPELTDRPMFAGSEGPTVDSSGAILFETAAGSYGVITLSVICLDDGGMLGGGSDTSERMHTVLRVLPRPAVACVKPALLPVTAFTAAVAYVR